MSAAFTPLSFCDVVEAADALTPDEQEALVQVIRRRLTARSRERILRECAEGEAEHRAGRLQPMTVEEIMREIGQ